MSGGRPIVWLFACSAVIGVPAAMRPITGIITTARSSSGCWDAIGRTLPSVPSMTDGSKRLPRAIPEGVEDSGSRSTSSARARFGSRRMNPRSSSAMMSR